MKEFEVEVDGFTGVIFNAPNAGKARAAAWRAFNEAYRCSFRRFLSISVVRPVRKPVT